MSVGLIYSARGGRYFLVDVVHLPDARPEVPHGHQLIVTVVIEADLVDDIDAGGVAAKTLAGGDLPDDQPLVVLAAEGGEIELVVGEGQALHQHLVQFESVQQRQLLEVPYYYIRLVISSFWFRPTWKPMCVLCPLAMYLPVGETVITEMSLSWPYYRVRSGGTLRNCCVRVMTCRTTMVEPRG